MPQISEISNDRTDIIIKREYAHLKDLLLSDVSKEKDLLEIYMLISADYLCALQSGKVVKGKVGEPVAFENCLGWVLSYSMKGST